MVHRLASILGLCLVLAGAVSLTPNAKATIMEAATIQQLVGRSERIVRGRVHEVRTHESPDGDVWTSVVLTDNTAAKGAVASDRFRFLCLGGTANGKTLSISGIPHFQEGDEAIVFYAPEHGICQVMGWTQGVFRITRDPTTNQEIVIDDHGNIIVGVSRDGLVKGRKPDWLAENLSAPIAMLGEPTSIETDTMETLVTADDFFEELRIMARTVRDETVKATDLVGTEANFILRTRVAVDPTAVKP